MSRRFRHRHQGSRSGDPRGVCERQAGLYQCRDRSRADSAGDRAAHGAPLVRLARAYSSGAIARTMHRWTKGQLLRQRNRPTLRAVDHLMEAFNMNTRTVATAAAATLILGLTACSHTKELEKQVADLTTKVNELQSQVQSSRQAAEQATAAAQSASQAASSAQSTASQALAGSQSTEEKIDRVIRQAAAK